MRIIAFEKPVDRTLLSDIKIHAMKIEKRFSIRIEGTLKRTVNIDPGLLSLENFILSTGKNYTHRIYIGKCIWADLTLIYSQGAFADLPWTYPNYRKQELKSEFLLIRKKYSQQIKK